MSGLVAIHQPNFFPWLGYFDKIKRADVFVFLDVVDYPRAGSSGMGSWTNRTRIDVQGAARWITCPVRRMRLGAPISDARIDDSQNWRTRIHKTLAACYGRAHGYAEGINLVRELLDARQDSLADFNIGAITAIAQRLGLTTHFVRQSQIAHSGKGTELLISLTKGVGGHAYLAGGGASSYQLDGLFAQNGVDLVYQCFKPKAYGDMERFIPGLSVIDFLMRTAPEDWPAL